MHALARLAAMSAAVTVLAIPVAGLAQGAAQPDLKPGSAKPAQAATAAKPSAAPKAAPQKPGKPMTRREEIEHAIETRSVPSHYRSSVPKEYQKYIPFAK